MEPTHPTPPASAQPPTASTSAAPPRPCRPTSDGPDSLDIEPRRLETAEVQRVLLLQGTPDDRLTPDDRSLLAEWRIRNQWETEQLQARRAAQSEAKARQDEEGRRATAAYIRALNAPDLTDRDSLAYFSRQLRQRTVVAPAPRLTDTPEQAARYLAAAYASEVQSKGRQPLFDDHTNNVIALAARWLSTHTKPCLLLRGNVGVGKTSLLEAIRTTLLIRTGQSMPVWDARRIAALGKGDEGQSVLDQLKKQPLLGIDDLGTEPLSVKNYGNETTPLVELLTDRYSRRLFTVITTNLAVVQRDGRATDELQETYGDRLYDRLCETYNTISYSSDQPSYRRLTQPPGGEVSNFAQTPDRQTADPHPQLNLF